LISSEAMTESTLEENSNRAGARFWGLLILLVLSGVVINVWHMAGEAHVDRQPLSAFPTTLGNWNQLGPDQRFDAATEGILRADDYLVRNFASSTGQAASFYAGYYATQRNGATYHSPLNCLPGAGWTMTSGKLIEITPANGGKPFTANRYVIQNGSDRQLMIYWYQGRGRALASEYWGKIYTVVDSVRLRRSDGAMVRIAVPITASEDAAGDSAADLATQVSAVLPNYIPN
jgi:EpsI family protein